MRVLIQWTNQRPGGWSSIDSSDWARLPRKSQPKGMVALDQYAGWVNAICIQGLVIQGDAVAVRHDNDQQVTAWLINDSDSAGRYARQFTIKTLAPDPALGGAYNTRIDQVIYTDDMSVFHVKIDRTIFRPWSAFKYPPAALIRYGALISDQRYAAHVALQTPRSWREWTQGVESALCCPKSLRLRDQRHAGRWSVPKGTRTYYLNNVALANPLYAADFELALENTPGGAALLTTGPISNSGTEIFIGVSPAGEPDSAAWPAGTYRFQIDVNAINSDVTVGLLDQQNGAGHFARVDAAIATELEMQQQAEGAFSLPGLKLATNGGAAWAAGSATDRFQILISGDRSTGMGTGTCTLEVGEADDFADGPWLAAGALAGNSPFFGMNS